MYPSPYAGRDCGDETDVLHARTALEPLHPVCPKCFGVLVRPHGVSDTALHEVVCTDSDYRRCGQRVMARFYREQA
jgi:hypothetical protein